MFDLPLILNSDGFSMHAVNTLRNDHYIVTIVIQANQTARARAYMTPFRSKTVPFFYRSKTSSDVALFSQEYIIPQHKEHDVLLGVVHK